MLILHHGFEPISENEWRKGKLRLIDTNAPSVLEVPSEFGDELAVVLSTHKSRIREKVMTAHFPGNWSGAELGGAPRTLVKADASALKKLIWEIKKQADMIGWNTMLEADHHGPTGNSPMIFVEIGSGEEEWADEKAAKGMADALITASEKEESYEAFLGFGGGHYPKAFTKMIIEGPMAVAHICPKYAIDSLDEALFGQAVSKTIGKISKVVVLKDETNREQKAKVKNLAEKFGLVYEEI